MWGRNAKRKFKNTKVEKTPGHWFDSRAEAALHTLLSLRERAGEIRDLAHHPGTVFLSEARVQYRPDFRYIITKTGEVEHAEFKGVETSSWRIKRKLWIAYGPTRLVVWRGSVSSMKIVEVLGPGSNK